MLGMKGEGAHSEAHRFKSKPSKMLGDALRKLKAVTLPGVPEERFLVVSNKCLPPRRVPFAGRVGRQGSGVESDPVSRIPYQLSVNNLRLVIRGTHQGSICSRIRVMARSKSIADLFRDDGFAEYDRHIGQT